MKILLVDDSRFVRVSVKKHLLSFLDQEQIFLEAASGTEAISLIGQEDPDIVFLDLLMPDITGEDVLKEVRKKEYSGFIVILTSNFQKKVKERLLSMGANLFMEKTISKEKLSSIMQSYESSKE